MKSIITRLSLLFLTALIFGTSLITAIRPERVLAATGADEFAFVYDPTNVGAKDKSGLINALDSEDQMRSMGTYILAAGGLFNGQRFNYSAYLECTFVQTDCIQADNDSHQEHKYINSYYCWSDGKGNWSTKLTDPGNVKGDKYKYEASVIAALSTNVNKDTTYTYYPNITRVDYYPPPPGYNQAQTKFNWSITDINGTEIKAQFSGDDQQAKEALYNNRLPKQCLVGPFRQIASPEARNPVKLPARPMLINYHNKPKDASKAWDKQFKGATTENGGTGSSTGVSKPGITCNTGLNPLLWLVCPVVDGMVEIANTVDNIILSQMSVGSDGSSSDPSQIFCSGNTKEQDKSKCRAYKTAWYSFRNLALGLLAIVGLIVIISQVADLEIFNAYTVKKILPRLIFAAIAISLSWQLMQFFVTLTNDLGLAVRNIIYFPFKSFSGGIHTGGATVTLLVGGAGVLALGVFGLLSFALTAALAALVAFFTMVLRQLLIILLIIVAPIAIVAYVLPNTERVYKMWWENFSKALLMFPLIVGFIAIGHVFASIALTGGGNNAISTFIAFAAYFGPYFMLPATFKFAGGMLSAASGAVNRAAAPGMQGLQSFRANRRKERFQDAKEGRLLKGNDVGNGLLARGRRLTNRYARGAALTPEAIKSSGFTLNPRSHIENVRTTARNSDPGRWDKTIAEDADVSSNMYNRAVMGAAAHADQSRAGLRQYLQNTHGLHGDELETSISKAQKIRRKLGANGSSYAKAMANAQISDGDDAAVIYRDIATAANGDQSIINAMIPKVQQTAKQAGRHDVAVSHGAGLAAVEGIAALGPNDTATDDQGNIIAGSGLEAVQNDLMIAATRDNPGQLFSSIKANRVEAAIGPLATEYEQNSAQYYAACQAYNNAVMSRDPAAIQAAGAAMRDAERTYMTTAADVAQVYESTRNAPSEVRDALQEHLLGRQVPIVQRNEYGEAITNKAGLIQLGIPEKRTGMNKNTRRNAIDVAHSLDINNKNRVFRERSQQFDSGLDSRQQTP